MQVMRSSARPFLTADGTAAIVGVEEEGERGEWRGKRGGGERKRRR